MADITESLSLIEVLEVMMDMVTIIPKLPLLLLITTMTLMRVSPSVQEVSLILQVWLKGLHLQQLLLDSEAVGTLHHKVMEEHHLLNNQGMEEALVNQANSEEDHHLNSQGMEEALLNLVNLDR